MMTHGDSDMDTTTVPNVLVRNFSKQFGQRQLWHDLNFNLADGDMVALRGESGAGKTTLLHCLGGLEPFDGSVHVDGTDIRGLRGVRLRAYLANTVTYLFQNYGLIDNWTVQKNLDVVRRRHSPGEFASMKAAALEKAGVESNLWQRRVFGLSGGEQQRVALARAFLKGGKLILADEPTSALDDDNTSRLLDVLQELAEAGASLLIATHDPRVLRACSRSIVLGTIGSEERPYAPVKKEAR